MHIHTRHKQTAFSHILYTVSTKKNRLIDFYNNFGNYKATFIISGRYMQYTVKTSTA